MTHRLHDVLHSRPAQTTAVQSRAPRWARRTRTAALTAIVCALAGVSGAVQAAALPIAEAPLYLSSRIKPAFLMTVDDSGSMTFETLFPGRDGQAYWDNATASTNGFFDSTGALRLSGDGIDSQNQDSGSFHHVFSSPGHRIGSNRYSIPPIDNFGFSRSPEFNPAYFNPAVTYGPWQNQDGSVYANASTTATRVDPRNSTPTYNMTADHYDRTDDTEPTSVTNHGSQDLAIGDTLQPGWQYRNASNATQNCTVIRSTDGASVTLVFPASGSSYATVPANTTYRINGSCTSVVYQDLHDKIPATDELFLVPNGSVLPSGTFYYLDETASCGGLGAFGTLRQHWVLLTADHTMTRDCEVGVRHFPATFYLRTATAAPTGFVAANRVLATNACGNGCNMYRYEIKPANYSTTAAYNAAIQNFANWFSFYGDRNRSMVAALTQSLADVDFMRIGYFTINSGYNSGTNAYDSYPTVTMRDMEVTADRTALYTSLTSLDASGSTPNRWAVQHLGEQFKRTDAAAPIQLACQINAGMLFTDGYSNQNGPTVGNIDGAAPFNTVPFTDGNSNTMADIAAKYYNDTLRTDLGLDLVPTPSGCLSSTPDKHLDCRNDPHMNFYGITLGAKGDQYGVTYIEDPATNVITPDPFVTQPAWPARQNDDPSTVDDIWHATINARGRYVNATTPADITDAMNDVLESVTNAASRSGGTAASSARLSTDFRIYVPYYDPNDWTGDVKAFSLLENGQLGAEAWSANNKLPSSRNILVSVPSGSSFTAANFDVTGLGGTSVAETRLGFAAGGIVSTYGSGRTVTEVVNYLRGTQTLEQSSGGPFRTRASKIGDVLNAVPRILGRGAQGGYSRLSSLGASYRTFVETTKAQRRNVLFVGANDGMLHGFDASGSGDAGKEIFAFVPNAVLNKMNRLVSPAYSHTYFVDSGPTISDAYLSGGWKTVLVAGLGAGGRGIYALNVTNPAASFNTTNFLWEFQHADLGYTFTRPRVILAQDGNFYAIFGNGVNSTNHRAYLMMVNMSTGALTKAIEASATAGGSGNITTPNGLGAVIAIDTPATGQAVGDGMVDTVYAADFRGKLWRFDLSAATSSGWTLSNSNQPVFAATDTDNNAQYVTGGLEVARHPLGDYLVYFGTGKYFLTGDNEIAISPALEPVQTFYAIWDKRTGTTVPKTDLVAQTITNTTTVTDPATGAVSNVRTTSSNAVDYRTKKGWYVNLIIGTSRLGERFIGEPVVALGRVFFTSFTHVGGVCTPGGQNWAYALDAVYGAPGANLPDGTVGGCGNCGSVLLTPAGTSSPPAVSPPLVLDSELGGGRAEPACDPSIPGDCTAQPPCDPTAATGPTACPCDATGTQASCPDDPADDAAVTSEGACVVKAKLLVAADQAAKDMASFSCGRMSWRQIR